MDDLEKDIKDKLEQRELQPSDKVWASIDKSMERPKTRNDKKRYFIYGIAAGILIILGVLGLNQLIPDNPPLDDSNEISLPTSIDRPIRKPEIPVNAINEPYKLIPYSYVIDAELMDDLPISKELVPETLKDTTDTKSLKAERILAEVETEMGKDSLKMEVQKLLDQAQDKLKKASKEQITNIDAKDLLESAEVEIESETLKEKILFALSKKVDQTKKALTQL